MYKDKTKFFLKELDSQTKIINGLTILSLIFFYILISVPREPIVDSTYEFFSGISINIIAVLIGIMVSHWAFSRSRKIKEEYELEKLAGEISSNILDEINFNTAFLYWIRYSFGSETANQQGF